MLESVKELRKYVDEYWPEEIEAAKRMRETKDTAPNFILRIADAIEQEVKQGYVELPKDADGEYIHIGDKLVGTYLAGKHCTECTGIRFTADGHMIQHGMAEGTPDLFTHHKPPTVEDVMFQFYKECRLHDSELGFVNENGKERAVREIADAFKDKYGLRLAGEENA